MIRRVLLGVLTEFILLSLTGCGVPSADQVGGLVDSRVADSVLGSITVMANATAEASGRDTTLGDVVTLLPAPDAPAVPGQRTPVFTVGTDRVTATVTLLDKPITCQILISGGKAVASC